MKKTIYFTSSEYAMHNFEKGVKSVTDKRDDWLTENNGLIGKIDSEDIKIIPHGPDNSSFRIIIQLSIYPKK